MTNIVVPENLSAEQSAEYIREELIKHNIDPDSVYPIDAAYASSTEPFSTCITLTYAHFDYETETLSESPNKILLDVPYGENSVKKVLDMWEKAVRERND